MILQKVAGAFFVCMSSHELAVRSSPSVVKYTSTLVFSSRPHVKGGYGYYLASPFPREYETVTVVWR